MLHCLQFSSYRLLPVLRHKSKVAYSSSAIGPSSPANLTSNLENHASRSSNNEQALMGSISLCICPHCCNVLVETFTVHVTHRTTVLRKEVQMRTHEVAISFWQWSVLPLLSHSHRKQGNLVYPTCSPSKRAMIFRSAQIFYLYVSTACIAVTASC